MTLTEREENGVLIVEMAGELDVSTSDTVRDKLLAVIDSGKLTIALNLQGVDYISSSGLRVFILVLKKLRSLNGSMALYGIQEKVAQVFRLAGFLRLFTVVDSETEAIDAVRKT